jgi:hypothetical protein
MYEADETPAVDVVESFDTTETEASDLFRLAFVLIPD